MVGRGPEHSGGADQASPHRGGGNRTSPSDLRGESLLAPNLAEGLSEHVSKAYKAGTSVISLEKSHTSDLMRGGRGGGGLFCQKEQN